MAEYSKTERARGLDISVRAGVKRGGIMRERGVGRGRQQGLM